MAFTTWNTLYAKMLDDLANNNATNGSYSGPGGRRIEFRSHDEWLKQFQFVKTMAGEESGTVVRRTYAKPKRNTW